MIRYHACEHRSWYTLLGKTVCMDCRAELPYKPPPPATTATIIPFPKRPPKAGA